MHLWSCAGPSLSLLLLVSYFFLSTNSAQNSSKSFNGGVRNQKPKPQAMTLRNVLHHDLKRTANSLQMRPIPSQTLFAFDDGSDSRTGMSHLDIQTRHEPITVALPKAQVFAGAELMIPIRHLVYEDAKHYWQLRQSVSPDISHKETLINLAKMSSDAYYIDPSNRNWLNISQGFNHSHGFGWDSDGLAGQVFANEENSTVIIAFKGTSICILPQRPVDSDRPKDRLNDNLLFSCCCATQRPNPYWYGKVCDCRKDVYRCNSTCLTDELARNDRYYVAALQIYGNVTAMYPTARMWTVGHSLGGVMASLIGLTYNIPAVTFEIPPQRLAAERLGLAFPTDDVDLLGRTGQYHFGNTADPIFMGSCNGAFSTCAAAGFNFESQCFTGMRCVYDTVEDKKWYASINHHRLNNVIPYVLEAYDSVANCTLDEECVDCYNWKFEIYNNPEKTTSY